MINLRTLINCNLRLQPDRILGNDKSFLVAIICGEILTRKLSNDLVGTIATPCVELNGMGTLWPQRKPQKTQWLPYFING